MHSCVLVLVDVDMGMCVNIFKDRIRSHSAIRILKLITMGLRLNLLLKPYLDEDEVLRVQIVLGEVDAVLLQLY